mmetsp:Transcript_12604/g.36019  ORF Transcript_12604/g.36019 Transcript_12604/m.36019 type:complete len:281 (-) Transcript_12604:1724-2566(-)
MNACKQSNRETQGMMRLDRSSGFDVDFGPFARVGLIHTVPVGVLHLFQYALDILCQRDAILFIHVHPHVLRFDNDPVRQPDPHEMPPSEGRLPQTRHSRHNGRVQIHSPHPGVDGHHVAHTPMFQSRMHMSKSHQRRPLSTTQVRRLERFLQIGVPKVVLRFHKVHPTRVVLFASQPRRPVVRQHHQRHRGPAFFAAINAHNHVQYPLRTLLHTRNSVIFCVERLHRAPLHTSLAERPSTRKHTVDAREARCSIPHVRRTQRLQHLVYLLGRVLARIPQR